MRIKLFVGSLVLLVVGFLLGWSVGPKVAAKPVATTAPAVATSTPAAAVPQSKTVSLMLDYGDGTVKTFTEVQLTDGMTLFDLTKRLAEANQISLQYDPPGQYGIFVKAIGGLTGGVDGKYWTYWVNNKMGEVAADQYKLQTGDAAEWKFVKLKL